MVKANNTPPYGYSEEIKNIFYKSIHSIAYQFCYYISAIILNTSVNYFGFKWNTQCNVDELK